MDELDEDNALEDEAELESLTSGGKRTINQTKGGKIDVAPEDSIAPADRDGEDATANTEAFPLNLSITIDKGAIGATNIIARAEDGAIEIEYVHFYPRAELIDPKTTETVKESQNVYGGPPFPYLDPDLQQMYENYINERGINTQLAWFLARYVEYKEQREYMLWLESEFSPGHNHMEHKANKFCRYEEFCRCLDVEHISFYTSPLYLRICLEYIAAVYTRGARAGQRAFRLEQMARKAF